jgi:predicted O-methyltransferase YrrM
MSDPTALAAWLVRALQARRVLEIGTGDAIHAVPIAAALPAGGMLITVEPEPSLAANARVAVSAAGHADKVTVIAGDPTRYLHKIAGPFDLIVHDGSRASAVVIHERLWQLLRPSGLLYTHNLHESGDYNVRLGGDARFDTMVLSIGDGVALSVRRADP